MPLIVILPLLAGGMGYGAGIWTGSGVKKLLVAGAMAGGVYATYRVLAKGGQ
ncbi:hypothetical protein [Photobacterium halotolerans]|uniref:hypothetical protein n=1 Tax=Photobacterium halotolerans TaxID=265726 RepID=UPI00192A1706|nr:hypothetical protein [Photobacterium halotolerans]